VLKFPVSVSSVEFAMPSSGWLPRIVPCGADQTVYLVIDRFRGLGTVYRETEVERADLETIIADLMSGQFNDPLRVVAFNTLEHRSEEQNISPSKFKPAAKALRSPSISAISSRATPVLIISSRSGWRRPCGAAMDRTGDASAARKVSANEIAKSLSRYLRDQAAMYRQLDDSRQTLLSSGTRGLSWHPFAKKSPIASKII
jgi:hypothetical protein